MSSPYDHDRAMLEKLKPFIVAKPDVVVTNERGDVDAIHMSVCYIPDDMVADVQSMNMFHPYPFLLGAPIGREDDPFLGWLPIEDGLLEINRMI